MLNYTTFLSHDHNELLGTPNNCHFSVLPGGHLRLGSPVLFFSYWNYVKLLPGQLLLGGVGTWCAPGLRGTWKVR